MPPRSFKTVNLLSSNYISGMVLSSKYRVINKTDMVPTLLQQSANGRYRH